MIHAVTVYCSSSAKIDRVFLDAAAELGRALAANHWKLVYGGNNVGCMGVLADSVRRGGGKVIGVTPQLFVDKGSADPGCDELIVTTGMRDRKAIMEERGDAFIALPGGLGTLEEILEILCGKLLGYHAKPIVLLNIAGYYQPLLDMFERGIDKNFIKSSNREIFFVVETVAGAIDHLRHYIPPVPKVRSYEVSSNSAAE